MLFIAASFGKKSSLSFEPFFDGRSSFELCLDSFSKAACESKKIAVFCDEFSSGAVKSFLKDSQKYGDIYLVEKKIRDIPILLLDDVLSELDSNRQNYLLNSIKNIQTMITCTGLDDFVDKRFQINKIFKIENGSIIV